MTNGSTSRRLVVAALAFACVSLAVMWPTWRTALAQLGGYTGNSGFIACATDRTGNFVVVFDVQGLQPSLESIQANIFTPTCSIAGCHSGPAGPILPSGMDLSSADASFASLINVASIEVPMTPRVAAGDANNSYLVNKLEGTAAVGARMPLGGPFLDQSTIDVIRLWIDSGAGR